MRDVKTVLAISLILILSIQPVSSSEFKIDLTLDKYVVYAGDEVGGTFYLNNAQNKFVDLYYAKIILMTSSSKIVQESIINLSVSVPPFYSDTLPVSFAIPDVPEGEYLLRFELNHSQGISVIERQIVVKSKKILAEQEIKKVEEIIAELHRVELPAEGRLYLLKAEESLNKSKKYYFEGKFSLSYDYARVALQYAKIAIGEREYEEKNVTLPKESRQPLINYSEIENVIKKIREIEAYTPHPPKSSEVPSQSNTLDILLFALVGINMALVIIVINKFLIKKK